MRRKQQNIFYSAINFTVPSIIIVICVRLFSVKENILFFYLYIVSILYGIAFIIFYLIDSTDMIDEEANRTTIASKMLSIQKEYYTGVEKSQKDIIALRHDFRKHLQILSSLIRGHQHQEALQYVEQIYEETNKIRVPIVGGNSMINIMLNDCQLRANQVGIKVFINVMVPKKLSIHNTDVCIILGNLIDNALEACERMNEEDPSKKYIKMDIRVIKSFLFIKIVNSYDGRYEYKNNTYKTMKTGEFHGIGLSNIQSVVKKLEGTLKLTPSDTEFTVSIMLPLQEGDHEWA